jgi:hypothetical protein
LDIVAKISIPQRNRAGLSKLLTLPSHGFEQLVASIQAQTAKIDLPVRLPDIISLPDVSKSELDQIVTAVTSMCVVRWSRDVSIEAFVNDVADAIQLFDPIGSAEESKRRLRRLLSIESLIVSAKALTIFADYQRTLHTSKVLTDLRYVFRAKPEEEPYGAVIVHLLKLTYHEYTEHKEFFVALDDNDLSHLRQVIDRAEAKARTLRRSSMLKALRI